MAEHDECDKVYFIKILVFEIATSERTRSEPGFFGSRRSRSRLSLLSLSLSLWRRPVVGRCLAREGDVLASRLSAALRSRSARTAAASVTAPAVVPRLMAAAGGGAGRGGAVVWRSRERGARGSAVVSARTLFADVALGAAQ